MKALIVPMALALTLLNSQAVLSATPLNDSSIGMPNIISVDSRCNLSLENAVVDYGTMSRGQLQEVASITRALSPGKRILMVNAVCPYTQAMYLTLRGEAAANGNLRYGDRGHMHVHLMDAQLDGQMVQVATTTFDGVLNAQPSSTLTLQPGHTFAAVIGGGVAKGRSLILRLEIEPILPENEARVSSSRVSEAKLTLNLW